MPRPLPGLLLATLLLVAPQRADSRGTATPFAATTAPPGPWAPPSRGAAANVAAPAAPTAPTVGVSRSYRTDALLIRLTEEAARTIKGTQATLEGGTGRRGMAPIRLRRLGLPGVDAALSAMPGVSLEPEFLGDWRAAQGANGIEFVAFWIAHVSTEAGGPSLEDAGRALRRAPEVRGVERIAILPVEAVPNDSLWSAAYYFYQPSRRDIHASEAWDVTRGDTSIVVAIIDTGVLPYHPDLQAQLWTNAGERGGISGADDDENGFVDDLHGWDFVDLPRDQQVQPGEDGHDQDNDPNDFAGHGTAVAGVIGAQTDNRIGVAGTAWQVRLMPLRVGWSSLNRASGEIDLSFVAQAIRYATRMGARVINCSFSSVFQPDLEAALTGAFQAGVTVVAAAGNNDTPDVYLGDRPEVISVAATDENDQVTRFSNRGSYVDLAAPGLDIATTSLARVRADSVGRRQPAYTRFANGTSFAAPLVSGAVALLQAQRLLQGKPPLTPIEARDRLVETADDIAAENSGDSGYGSGRLNLFRALTDPPVRHIPGDHLATIGPPVVLPTLSGSQRLAVVTADGRLLLIEANRQVFASVRLSAPPQGGLAAADLGGGRGVGMFVVTTDSLISGFDAGGHRLPGWPVAATTSSDVSSAEPLLGDLDGDGVPEVVWGGDGSIWAWRIDGTPLRRFPRKLGGQRNLQIALSDLDGRPGAEIVVTLRGTGNLACVLSGDGSILPSWPHRLLSEPMAPVITRLGHDPRPAVIVATANTIYAFDVDGTERWERYLPGTTREPPLAADLNGDGSDELIFPQWSSFAVLDSSGATVRSPVLPALPGLVLGPTAIGPLGHDGGPAILQFVTGDQLLAFDSTGVMITGFPKREGAGEAPTLADLDHDGRTDIVAGSGLDSLIHIYGAGPGSWRGGSDPGWPTARGNFARTGSRLYSPPMAVSDNIPPNPVNDLAAGLVDSSAVEITWTAPADVGSTVRVSRYELRQSRTRLTPENFTSGDLVAGVPIPGEHGAHERILVSPLAEGATYYFAIRSFDGTGNASAISNVLRVSTVTAVLATVTDLTAFGATDSSVALRWAAIGGDETRGQPRAYLLRASPWPFDEATFDQAPIAWEAEARVNAGRTETTELTRVRRGERYWVALEAVDRSGNRSPLSNLVQVEVGATRIRGLALAARARPSRPPVEIAWERPVDVSRGPQEIRIYDVAGRLRRLHPLGSGDRGVVVWDGRDADGRNLPSGLYLARLVSGGLHAESRIILLR